MGGVNGARGVKVGAKHTWSKTRNVVLQNIGLYGKGVRKYTPLVGLKI